MTKVILTNPSNRTPPGKRKIATTASVRWTTIQDGRISTIVSYKTDDEKVLEDVPIRLDLSANGVRDIAAMADNLERKIIKHAQEEGLLEDGTIEGDPEQ